jgi:hypothetical protein
MLGGYKRKSYVLRWPEDHVHHGLVVKLRGLSIKDLNIVQSMRGIKSEEDLNGDIFGQVLGVLAARIIEWNLTDDDDTPLPHTASALAEEDFGMVTDIITAWTKAVTGVSAPLDARSTSGETFQEASIPMETSSTNPTN